MPKPTRFLPAIIIALITFIGATSIFGFVVNLSNQSALDAFSAQSREVRVLQTALIDAEAAVRAYLLDAGTESLDRYIAAERRLAGTSPAVLQLLDERSKVGGGGSEPVSKTLSTLWSSWEAAIRLGGGKSAAEAARALGAAHEGAMMQRLRAATDRDLALRAGASAEMERRLYNEHLRLLVVVISLAVIAVAAMIYAFHSADREMRGRERSIAESRAAHKQIEHLFFMADMLQSAADMEDTNAVLRATAGHLLPGFGGAMYVFNNSRDRLDLATRWGGAETTTCAAHFHPDSCWSLKRGKANLNGTHEGALRCGHVGPAQLTLEIPMSARGQLHGLLEIICEGPDAERHLQAIRPIAAAIGDAMSLALSSMALRDRLRNQALKDALTGLYNRRFLEETLERMCMDAERRQSPMCVIMIDLDHFKRLNDVHGHAAGDRVLREVAKSITGSLRQTDIACRYGGEELCLLLPDCPLEMGAKKAEEIRNRIADLALDGLVTSASLGVACLPETSSKADLLTAADAALYQAKQRGRDRVVVAPVRTGAQRLSVVEGGQAAAEAV